ncbi:MAG: J domain-containing protein, partial [Thermodesulfobacteriota bacterium]
GGGVGKGGLEDIFSAFFEGRGAPAPPRRGTDIESALEIDFMQAAIGSEFKITLTRGNKREKLTVKIPPGVEDGSKVKLRGKGNPGMKGAPSGDLFITTKVKAHKYFTRKGNNIYLDVPVTISEALLGASVTVPTLTGTKKVKIPPGTKSGVKLRVKGEGVKGIKGAKGDIYLKIMIGVPKKIDKRSKEIIEEFAKINSYEPRSGLW